jgi:glutamyl-tRNA synthetase
MVNYLVRLGWSYGDEEIFTLEDLITKFSIESVGRSAGVFNPDKLLWLNAHYIKTGDPKRLAELLKPFLQERGVDWTVGPDLVAVVRTLLDRSRTMLEMADGTIFYFASDFDYEEKSLAKFLTPAARELCAELVERLKQSEDLGHDSIAALFDGLCADKGVKMKDVAQPARYALTGGSASPGIYDVIGVLGRDETIRRIRRALAA